MKLCDGFCRLSATPRTEGIFVNGTWNYVAVLIGSGHPDPIKPSTLYRPPFLISANRVQSYAWFPNGLDHFEKVYSLTILVLYNLCNLRCYLLDPRPDRE